MLPALAMHRCRGPEHYHFARIDGNGAGAGRADGSSPPSRWCISPSTSRSM
jgi:hypothetical protein